MAESAIYAQAHDVTESLEDPFAKSRARDVKTLIDCMDRKRRYGPALEAIEIDEMGELLGKRPASRVEGDLALSAAIRVTRRERWRRTPSTSPPPSSLTAPIIGVLRGPQSTADRSTDA